jgi:Tfp pilus assembly protein PilV
MATKFLEIDMYKKQKRKKKSEQGFTLLETAVASMIILVGLMSTANLFVLAVLNNQASKQTTLATSLAKRKMEYLLSIPLSETALNLGGSVDATTTNYSEEYFVDNDRVENGVKVKGTWDVRIKDTTKTNNNAFYAGQLTSYEVRWLVQSDSVTDTVAGVTTPRWPDLKRITVRAMAKKSALQGNGVRNANPAQVEDARLSTIRIPPGS